jgi:hypothetical protein
MKRVINTMLLIVVAMILVSCGAASEQSGKMYYTVNGSTVTVYNTPAGTMKGEIPPGATKGGLRLYIIDKGKRTDDSINIEYDGPGVTSVTMKGVPIPRKN